VLSLGFNLAELIPLVGQVLDGEVAGFGYEIAKVQPQLNLGIYQSMGFQPNMQVLLQFNEPVLYNGTITREVVAPVGQSLNITPAVVGSLGEELVARPTYILDNTFENQTGISLSGDIDVDLLKLLDPIDQGPLYHTDLDLAQRRA